MRDIREDLRDRIELLESRRKKLETEAAAIEQQQVVLRSALEQEERLVGEGNIEKLSAHPEAGSGGKYDSPIAASVLRALRKHSPATLDMLKAQAFRDRIEFGQKTPGRVIHFLLLGMEQNGLVEHLGDGSWRLKEDDFGPPRLVVA